MTFIETQISDVKIFEPRVFEDQRGYFFEAYNEKTFFNELGRKPNFCPFSGDINRNLDQFFMMVTKFCNMKCQIQDLLNINISSSLLLYTYV